MAWQGTFIAFLYLCLPANSFHPFTVKDYIYPRHILRRIEKVDWLGCIQACLADTSCRSYSFRSSRTALGETCSLSECGISGNNDREAKLVFASGFVFQQLKTVQNSLDCQGGGQYIHKEHRLAQSVILHDKTKTYLDDLHIFLDPLHSKEQGAWIRCYHANSDGRNFTVFHENCDGIGPTVTIVRVRNYVFGGYSSVSWKDDCRFYKSPKSFLFSLYNVGGYSPTQLLLIDEQDQAALWGCSRNGPTFGHGFDLSLSYADVPQCYARPKTYAPPDNCNVGKSCNFFTGQQLFSPSDIEVFYFKPNT
ncbi:predicted protein [Nematostella vectensis]|uniref:TLDc domain-containing protein n=1 Tax=Nematostella vectensis TaxID=45351 RepID=A7RJV5_NEMVE|nr:uncharacterized protein LOC5520580 [Nematostella vectensis]EDO48431.1 predicted protein [Nematostella vectensis]|eukprot:XP_001640494.1 predicted protein [Nematostella vectensis]